MAKLVHRTPEPELMNDQEQADAYAQADFAEPHNYFVQLFGEYFPQNKPVKVLDLGCGPGDISCRFAKAHPESVVTGVDGAQAMLDAGAPILKNFGLGKRVQLTYGYLPNVELPKATYDTVISNSLLHHLDDPMVIWESIKKFGQPNSSVFIMDLMRPESSELAEQFVNTYANDEPEVLRHDFYHSLLAAYTLDEVKQQLAKAHLNQLKTIAVSDRHLIVHGYLNKQEV